MNVSFCEEHPLALELASLRKAITHYQLEAHRAAVQLRRHSLEAATAIQRLHALENENSYLRAELAVHRAHADAGANASASHRDTLQVQELTLALRRLSDKLDLTEKALLMRNEELVTIQSERDTARSAKADALEAVMRMRVELHASRTDERELANRVKLAEEQRKLSDLVVQEYADLVRSLEGRSSTSARGKTRENGHASRSSLDGLMYARQGLQKLLQESNSDSEKLHTEIGRLHDALEMAQAGLQAERKVAVEDKRQLALAQLELHQLETDDNAAAKMVSRYMKFSQSSTDVLHSAIENLKARHASTISTYESRFRQVEDRLASEMRQSEHLRRALDELTEDISRESYGRRREVSLRLALLRREEHLSERLKRWLLRAHDVLQKARSSDQEGDTELAFEKVLEAAEDILTAVDNPAVLDGDSVGTVGRVIAAQTAVSALREELQKETDRRLLLQHEFAMSQTDTMQPKILTPNLSGIRLSRNRRTSASLVNPAISVATDSPPASVKTIIMTENGRSNTSFPTSHPSIFISSVDDLHHPTLQQPVPVSLIPSTIVDDSLVSPDSSLAFTRIPTSLASLALPGISQTLVPKSSGPDFSEGSEASHLGNGYASEPMIVVKENFHEKSLETDVQLSLVHASGEAPTAPLSVDIVQPVTIDPDDVEVGATTDDASHSFYAAELPSLDNKSRITFHTQSSDSVFNSTHAEPKTSFRSAGMPQNGRYKDQLSSLLQPSTSSLLASPLPAELPGETNLSVSSLGKGPPSGQDSNFASLLLKLAQTEQRYDVLQCAFRDCHLSLKQLKQSLNGSSGSLSTLQTAVERLDDYCEDARVDLEIRITDEERITKGYQTLLSVPGALSDEVNHGEMAWQIEAFVDGSDPAVHRSQEMLKHKLDDLQHDIAIVKRVMHESPSLLSHLDISQAPEDHSKHPHSSWVSWTGSILSPSRSPSPAPSFGAVMTAQRLRHSPSLQRMRTDTNNTQFAGLGLRIPMPSQVQIHTHAGHPAPPASPLSHTHGAPRSRLASNMFSLGLGGGGGLLQVARKSSFALNFEKTSKVQVVTAVNSEDVESDVD